MNNASYDNFSSFETPQIEAWIARGRVKEMQNKGWRTLGPINDGMVWMSGPDPDVENVDCWGRLSAPAIAVPAVVPAAAPVVALRRPHGRRVA